MNIEKTIVTVIGVAAGAAGVVATFGIVVGIGIGLSLGTVAGLARIAVSLADGSATPPSRRTV